ncbi:hypothetical protein CEXT_731151 [Caerostris extrusa]|uniref:Uncharacterized protein n=1 Tax=Caerostris extrusa TaxID=172846 RepID=A0AAV4VXS5_CAEEX|nr:hypothetical protein CEXT_731151 [Caerostris extrusa]
MPLPSACGGGQRNSVVVSSKQMYSPPPPPTNDSEQTEPVDFSTGHDDRVPGPHMMPNATPSPPPRSPVTGRSLSTPLLIAQRNTFPIRKVLWDLRQTECSITI